MPEPLNPLVEMYLNGDWVEVAHVRQNPPIKISVGSKDESSKVSPGKCTFTLDNGPSGGDGDYDRRNPNGQYYGSLSKNTQVRVHVNRVTDIFGRTETNTWGSISGTTDSWTNGTSTGGTVANTDWTVSSGTAKHSVPAANAYRFSELSKNDRPFVNARMQFDVTLPVTNITGGFLSTDVVVRCLDIDNFVYARVKFGTDESVKASVVNRVAGAESVLLADTTVTGLSAATDSTFTVAVLVEAAAVRVKVWATGDPEPLDWHAMATRVPFREGYLGLISRVETGNSNTKPIVMAYDNLTVSVPLFHGEVSEFTPGSNDESNNTRHVAIEASGITRRVDQGSDPLKSTMFRSWSSDQTWIREGSIVATESVGSHNAIKATDADAADVAVGYFGYFVRPNNVIQEDHLFTVTAKNSSGGFTTLSFTPDTIDPIVIGTTFNTNRLETSDDNPVAYWPCEDGRDATAIGSGIATSAPMRILTTTTTDFPRFGENNSFFGSGSILKLNNCELEGLIPDYTDTNTAFSIAFLAEFPAVDEAATGQDLVQFYTTGSAPTWALQYETGGSDGDLALYAANGAGTILFETPYGMGMRGQPRLVLLNLRQNGGSVEYRITTQRVRPDVSLAISGPTAVTTATGVTTLGKINRVRVNPAGGYVDVAFGHLAVFPKWVEDVFNLRDPQSGYLNDGPPRRFARLAYEEHESFTYRQGGYRAQTLGSQQRATLLDNFNEVVAADVGMLFESRGAYSFEYRSRSSLYNQEPVLELDYEGGAVMAPLVPTDDDQSTRNDVTITRTNGSSYRATLNTGPLSIQPPPDGVGRYTLASTINLSRDSHVQGHAEWRLHLGTVDEYRYPTIRVLGNPDVVPLERFLSVGVGDRVVVSNLSAINIYDDVDQLVPGYTLTLHPYVPVLEMNCIPASPYHVIELGNTAASTLDSDTSTLSSGVNSSATSLSVAFTGPMGWTHSDGDFDIQVGGERMTVTNVTGSSSPQTFTVTRSVNGVTKSHSSGAAIHVFNPSYLIQ